MANYITVAAKLQDDLQKCTSQLIPFDKVFDEDNLEALREQQSIIEDEISHLETKLVAFICDPKEKKEDEYEAKYGELTEKLNLFCDRQKKTADLIHVCETERNVTYQIWKERYMNKTEEIADITVKLQRLHDLHEMLNRVQIMSSKPRHNLILMLQLQSHINFLLALQGIKREKSPFAAFRSAHNHGFIEDKVFSALMR